MKENLINNIIEKVAGILNKEQIEELKFAFYYAAKDMEITKKCTEITVIERNYNDYLFLFLAHKRSEGRSEETIEQYKLHLKLLLDALNKNINDITTDNLFTYLAKYKQSRKISNRSLDHKRRIFNSFFGWLCKKKYMSFNPAWGLDRISYTATIKKPLTDEDRELLRCACDNERNLAILDLLYSSAIRVGELVKLNRADINLKSKEILVLGKGGKEREVYINSSAAIHLQRYLDSRKDDNLALFVSTKNPYDRLTRNTIEYILSKLGKRAGINKVHPHRYRRTALTNAINRGMPVQEAKELAGHTDINTTMIYCSILRESLKYSHKKFLSA